MYVSARQAGRTMVLERVSNCLDAANIQCFFLRKNCNLY
jgi:hypothetical protein